MEVPEAPCLYKDKSSHAGLVGCPQKGNVAFPLLYKSETRHAPVSGIGLYDYPAFPGHFGGGLWQERTISTYAL